MRLSGVQSRVKCLDLKRGCRLGAVRKSLFFTIAKIKASPKASPDVSPTQRGKNFAEEYL